MQVEEAVPGLELFDSPDQTHVNILLYGPPKSGKSAAALTIPGSILYLNADTANSLWYGLRRRGPTLGRVRQGKLTGFDGLIALAQWLRTDNLEVPETIVLDPVADVYRGLLEQASNKAVRPRLDTYGDTGTYLERFFRSLCSAPVNAVFIAHDLPIKDEVTGEVEYLPSTGTSNPALGRKLMGMVDVLGYTGVIQQEGGEPRYVAQLLDGRGRHGGDRFNVLRGDDGVTADLDLGRWITKITEQGSVAPVAQEMSNG
jgi:hypothetical protein